MWFSPCRVRFGRFLPRVHGIFKADEIEAATGVPNIDLNRKAERLYEGLLGEAPSDFVARCNLLLRSLELADALAARGRHDESKGIEREALANAKRNPGAFVRGLHLRGRFTTDHERTEPA